MNLISSQTYWYEELHCPEGMAIHEYNIDRTALNSVAIVTGKPWQELVRSLVEQAHFRCNLPTYKTCVTDMIRANGFKPVRDHFATKETVSKLNAEFSAGKQYIVKLKGSGYYALVPDRKKGKYVFKGCKPHTPTLDNRGIDEMWLYVPGTDNRTGIKRASGAKRKPKDVLSLEQKNENPDGRLIGDCVIRAFAAVLECSWHDAVDILAETSAYQDPCINTTPNINNTLKRLGFKQCMGIMVGSRYASGKQICPIFDRMYLNGERIFAYVGKRHCAAIIPMESGGYKIQDTWDSTSREIIEYWVLKRPGREKLPEPQLKTDFPDYKVGTVINHPIYGKGIIRSHIVRDSGLTLEIHFESAGTKNISADWLYKHTLTDN